MGINKLLIPTIAVISSISLMRLVNIHDDILYLKKILNYDHRVTHHDIINPKSK